MIAMDPLRGGPAGPSTACGLSTTYSAGPSNSLGKAIANFINNEDEQTVLDSDYISFYRGVPVIRTNGDRSGFWGVIFLTHETNTYENPAGMVRHEYGHAIQMQRLGIIRYTSNILIPSWLQWGTNPDYYSREVEVTADYFGGVTSRSHTYEDIAAGFSYLENSKNYGIIAWATIN